MVIRPRYSIWDRILGRVPTTYILRCLEPSCDYHEGVEVSTQYEDEPYGDDRTGIRCLKRLPKRCPKCGDKSLKKLKIPLIHY